MTNTIKWVFFDLGGVVVDLRPCYTRLASMLGKPQPIVQQAYARHAELASRGRISTAEFWRRIGHDLELTRDGDFPNYSEFWTDNLEPIPETQALLREFPPTYHLAILSNTEFGVVDGALRKGRVPDLPYALVIKSCDVGFAKPDPQIYQIAQEKAGVQPGEILFTDDRQENVEAALAAGWQAIQFDSAHPARSVQEIRTILDT